MPLHPAKLSSAADEGPTPTVGFVLYAAWHADTPADNLVQAVTEVADALRELANDALPAAESVAAVAVSPAADGQPARVDQLRRAVIELAGGPASTQTTASPSAPTNAPASELGGRRIGLNIDRAERRVTLDGHELVLARLEFELLAFLAQHPRRVFTREHLLERVWRFEHPVGTRTVDAHVRRLRAKLGTEAHRLQTVRGVGYRWEASRHERLLGDSVGAA